MADKRTVQEKFWNNVLPTTPDECWLWRGCLDNHGYGRFETRPRNGRRVIHKAHRVSWELHNRPLCEGEVVRHTCDTPNCVNPNHLTVGTQVDNIKDMDSRGRRVNPFTYVSTDKICGNNNFAHNHPERMARGENAGHAKLTSIDVNKIRLLGAAHLYSQRKLAEMFGIRHSSLQSILNFKTWTHVIVGDE